MRRAARMAGDLTRQSVFDGKFEDRRHAIEAFIQWNERVKERVPAERLLVYEVKEGWEPLCDFCGVEAPEEEPFPREIYASIRPDFILAAKRSPPR